MLDDVISDLIIFNRISNEKIVELGDFFGDTILNKTPDMSKINKILGDNFKDYDIAELIHIFYNFTIGKIHSDKIFEIIKVATLDEDKKKVLVETVQKIHDKVSPDAISSSMQIKFLKTFGYPHTHGFRTVTEFRPISNKNKIVKFIPSLIVSINTHYSNTDKMVNFQLNLKDVKELIDELTSGADSLKTEIQHIRKKFGDEIID